VTIGPAKKPEDETSKDGTVVWPAVFGKRVLKVAEDLLEDLRFLSRLRTGMKNNATHKRAKAQKGKK